MIRSPITLLVTALFLRLCAAQASGWQSGQINTTMCQWTTPRVAVVRDTVYIDGGYLWWEPGFGDGSVGPSTADGNPLGLVYLLNFSLPFQTNPSFNQSALFTNISKAAGGTGSAANNLGPNYVDGTMLGNDFEWFTYGGLLQDTAAFTEPAADSVLAYEVYASGPPKQFEPGFYQDQLTGDITRYVAYGAGVSVPSENLGFYFSGLKSESGGPIYQGTGNESENADFVSPTLLQLDLAVEQQETWSKSTLPTSVPGRASAELVWAPVSEKGILVGIGGVINPAYAEISQADNATAAAQSAQQSPKFWSTVAIYDIANSVWYEQPTTGAPNTTQFARGCTVLASAEDGSSHNIYWYGGFDGIHQTGDYSDAVWVLSIPSFIWTELSPGNIQHARAGHRCVKPYPDQMFVIGGYPPLAGENFDCVDGGIIQVFNLSSGLWLNSYDPKVWSKYQVPSAVVSAIGGAGTGGATVTIPSPTGFASPSMTALFNSAYNTSKITTWYPYASVAPTSTPTQSVLPLPTPVSKSGTPSYLAPVLAVILGLFVITLIVIGILLWRRRRILSHNGLSQSEAGTMSNRLRVANWLRGQPVDPKAPTVTTDETPMTPDEYGVPVMAYMVPEVQGNQVLEMEDTSKPQELHATGMNPIFTNTPPSRGPSHASHASVDSTISGLSGRLPIQVQEKERITSGVSNVSESDRGHLRGISETSVSTDGAGNGVRGGSATPGLSLGNLPQPAVRPAVQEEPKKTVSPLTPPEGVGQSGSGDYLGAGIAEGQAQGQKPQSLAKRKSNFSEALDDGVNM